MEPFTSKFISELKEGKNVAIVGVIIEKSDSGYIIIEDGTGKATILISDDDLLKKFNSGDVVRVLGRVIGEGEVRAHIVQDFNGLDFDMYKEYVKLLHKSTE